MKGCFCCITVAIITITIWSDILQPNSCVRNYVEEGKHNCRCLPDTTVACKECPSSLLGKTSVGILLFLVQMSNIICSKLSPRYIIFPPALGISKEENAFSSLFNLILLLLKVSHRTGLTYLNKWKNWPKNTSIHLQNEHSLCIFCVSQISLMLRIQ